MMLTHEQLRARAGGTAAEMLVRRLYGADESWQQGDIWTAGLCQLLAAAVQRAYGLPVIWVLREGDWIHAANLLPDGTTLDWEQRGDSAEKLVAVWDGDASEMTHGEATYTRLHKDERALVDELARVLRSDTALSGIASRRIKTVTRVEPLDESYGVRIEVSAKTDFAYGRVTTAELAVDKYDDPPAGVLDDGDRDSIVAALAQLHVEPKRRGRGRGRQLVAQWLTSAREQGAQVVYLQALPDGAPGDPTLKDLVRFYGTFGFKVVPKAPTRGSFWAKSDAYRWMRLDLRA